MAKTSKEVKKLGLKTQTGNMQHKTARVRKVSKWRRRLKRKSSMLAPRR